jgi:predicted phosphodiesterase
MKIQILSDLHLEFFAGRWRESLESLDPEGVDVLVVAGDLCTPRLLQGALAALCCRYPEVVYVAGNHEYYDSSPERVQGQLAAAQGSLPNFHWLRNQVATIGETRFAGTTLWFRDDPSNLAYERGMNDFALIEGFKPWVYEENERVIEFLEREARSADVVVTHHLPSVRSVAPQYEGDPFNRFFLCAVDDLILGLGSTLWIHGHTHVSTDVRVARTRLVCNPLGYVPLHNPEFDEKLVIKVGLRGAR